MFLQHHPGFCRSDLGVIPIVSAGNRSRVQVPQRVKISALDVLYSCPDSATSGCPRLRTELLPDLAGEDLPDPTVGSGDQGKMRASSAATRPRAPEGQSYGRLPDPGNPDSGALLLPGTEAHFKRGAFGIRVNRSGEPAMPQSGATPGLAENTAA